MNMFKILLSLIITFFVYSKCAVADDIEDRVKELEAKIAQLEKRLSGLAAATILAKAGKKVEVHEIREDSGARFDGDFQGLENWTSSRDFFDEMVDWGLDPKSFKSTDFHEMALIHPDDEVTTPKSDRIAWGNLANVRVFLALVAAICLSS